MCHFTDAAMLTTLFELANLHQGVPDNGTTNDVRGASHACGAHGNGPAALSGKTDTGDYDHMSRDVLPSSFKYLGCHEGKQRSWKHIFLGRGDTDVSHANADASYWNTFGKRDDGTRKSAA